MTPSTTRQCPLSPSGTFQPLKSLPLNNDVKPCGGSAAEAAAANNAAHRQSIFIFRLPFVLFVYFVVCEALTFLPPSVVAASAERIRAGPFQALATGGASGPIRLPVLSACRRRPSDRGRCSSRADPSSDQTTPTRRVHSNGS